MLIHWQSHQEYLYFLHEAKVHFDSSQRSRPHLEFASVREKLHLLDLNPVMEYLSAWLKKLMADSLLTILIGCSPDSAHSFTHLLSETTHHFPYFLYIIRSPNAGMAVFRQGAISHNSSRNPNGLQVLPFIIS